jgi:hypothetical protein
MAGETVIDGVVVNHNYITMLHNGFLTAKQLVPAALWDTAFAPGLAPEPSILVACAESSVFMNNMVRALRANNSEGLSLVADLGNSAEVMQWAASNIFKIVGVEDTGAWSVQSAVTATAGLALEAASQLAFKWAASNITGTTVKIDVCNDTTQAHTLSPTKAPTLSPTKAPTLSPTKAPTISPTKAPTLSPTKAPTPTLSPTKAPTLAPTKTPTMAPTQGAEITLEMAVPDGSDKWTELSKEGQDAMTDKYESAMAKTLGPDVLVEVTIKRKNDPPPRVMPKYDASEQAELQQVIELAPVVEDSRILQLTQSPTKPPTIQPTEDGETRTVEKKDRVSIDSRLTLQMSVPVSLVKQVQQSVANGISVSLDVKAEQVSVGADTTQTTAGRSETEARRLVDGCDETLLAVILETTHENPNHPGVLQLAADFKTAATSGSMMANIKASAAHYGTLTNCLKSTPDKLPEPATEEKIVNRDVVVSSTDNDLVIVYKIKANSEAVAATVIAAVSDENKGVIKDQLQVEVDANGGGVGEIGTIESTILSFTGAPTRAPTNDPTSVQPPVPTTPAKSPTVEPTNQAARRSKLNLRPAALFAAILTTLAVMLVVGMGVVCGKNPANWPCCGAAAAKRRGSRDHIEPVEYADTERSLEERSADRDASIEGSVYGQSTEL